MSMAMTNFSSPSAAPQIAPPWGLALDAIL